MEKRSKIYAPFSNLKIADYFDCSLDFLSGRSDVAFDFQLQKPPAFSSHLRTLLKIKGITRTQINRDTRVKSSHFVDWKNGSDPHIFSLIELADYLDISLDILIGREKL